MFVSAGKLLAPGSNDLEEHRPMIGCLRVENGS
jgi:hypothetical protein